MRALNWQVCVAEDGPEVKSYIFFSPFAVFTFIGKIITSYEKQACFIMKQKKACPHHLVIYLYRKEIKSWKINFCFDESKIDQVFHVEHPRLNLLCSFRFFQLSQNTKKKNWWWRTFFRKWGSRSIDTRCFFSFLPFNHIGLNEEDTAEALVVGR